MQQIQIFLSIFGDSLELPKRLYCSYTRMFSDFEQYFLALFSSVQKGQLAPVLCMNVMHQCWNKHGGGGGLRKRRKTQNCILGGGNPWWPSFTSHHLVSHLGWQPLPEITKMAIITHKVNIENWILTEPHQVWVNLSTLTWCWPSWILAIVRNHKNGNYNSEST